jgi:hypothetical protein
MLTREGEIPVYTNWIAVFSYSASLVLSLAIWGGVFRALGYLVK